MTRHTAMAGMGWLLNSPTDRVPGVAHAVALSADGLLLTASGQLPDERAERLAAVTAGVGGPTNGTARRFGGGAVLQTIVEMDLGYLFPQSIRSGSLPAARAGDAGRVGDELALTVERAGSALSPLPRSAAAAPA